MRQLRPILEPKGEDSTVNLFPAAQWKFEVQSAAQQCISLEILQNTRKQMTLHNVIQGGPLLVISWVIT